MTDKPIDRGFWADMLRRVKNRTRSDAEAEDLLHSAYLRLFAYRAEHKVEQPVAFMVQTAAHLAVDRHRRRSRVSEQPLEDFWSSIEDTSPLQDEVLASRQRLRRVQAGLEQLSPRTRQIFVMHKVQGLKLREIARELGITQGAVEKHVAKAMLFLTEWSRGW